MATEVKRIPFLDLDTPVKEHVVKFMQTCIEQVLAAHTMPGQIATMLDQVNPIVIFKKDDEGRKTMTIDESDERISKFLFASYAAQAKNDPEIMQRIIVEMTRRTQGDERLRIK
ncbi:MAG TPA: hypothetical protein PKC38_00535 [Chitinophagales bacterium]|nr:hypothetical protein [Chitinophagales bacterium]